MSDYDQEYYFIMPMDGDERPVLSPDVNTEDRNFNFEKQAVGSPPFVFLNGAKDYQRKMRIAGMKIPPAILFVGTDLLVPNSLREALLEFDIPNLQMHPAVYIHDDGKWYEDYSYLTFTDRFDCWDRNTSNYEREASPVRLGGFELYQIYSHSLNQDLLDKTPLEQRLLFKLGGSLDAFVVCHRTITHLFEIEKNNSVQLIPISEY